MEDFLNAIGQYGGLVYGLLFVYCVVKSGALPLLGGIAAQYGALDIIWVFFAVFAGGYLGDELRFYLVRRLGTAALERRPFWAKVMQASRDLLHRYGLFYMFFYRYPKGLRTVGALPVALTDISWTQFTLLNISSAAIWSLSLVGVGYIFGQAIERTVNDNWGLLTFILLLIFVSMSYLAWRKLSQTDNPAKEKGKIHP